MSEAITDDDLLLQTAAGVCEGQIAIMHTELVARRLV